MRVRLSAWSTAGRQLRLPAVDPVAPTQRQERAPWPAKHPASSCPPTSRSTSAAWPTPPPPPGAAPPAPASSSAATRAWGPTSPATTTSPLNSAATPTPSPSGAAASAATAWPAFPTCPAVAARSLFPPEDRHKVLTLATTKPQEVGVPASHWSLDDLAYHILRDAHYRDMARSTVQRILAEADLKPHKSRYWLHSD